MPTWLKVVLILAGVGFLGFLGIAAVAGGGVWWFAKHKDQLLAESKQATAEGQAFGKTHTKDECIADGLTHLQTCAAVDPLCEAQQKIRLTACLAVARGGAGEALCAGVPAPTDFIKAALWANEECTRRGLSGNQACGRLMQGVLAECRATKR